MNTPVRVLLVGAGGRMGQAVVNAARAQAGVRITAECDLGQPIRDHIDAGDVVVDFSHADATNSNCSACVDAAKPLVIGTTGQSVEQMNEIEGAARSIPVVVAPNFSVGVNALFWLTRQASELLGRDFDIEIVETHHRLKKDAPSGTAKRLAQLLCEARGLDYDHDVAHGREGLIGERPAGQIGMHSIRAGDVVGDHTVIFATTGERVELTHKASSRETFAVGALRAASWVIGKPPGIYSMEDVLGLTDGPR